MMNPSPVIWMIRPWIYDFTAYDQFAQPRGFLSLASYFRECGCQIHYIDCLARPAGDHLRSESNGCGEYASIIQAKPFIFSDIPRNYRRYGISIEEFLNRISVAPPPDVVLITTGMTYWIAGISEVLRLLKLSNFEVPIAVGGVYPTICSVHARQSFEVDFIQQGNPGDEFLEWMDDRCDFHFNRNNFLQMASIIPAWDLIGNLRYGVIVSSRGCRCACEYCGAQIMQKDFISCSLDSMQREIEFLAGLNIYDLAFQDDDLGGTARDHFLDLLLRLEKWAFPVRWHIPNAINAACITQQTADLMMYLGFQQIRLSLPHINRLMSQQGLSCDAIRTLEHAAMNLHSAGYNSTQISMYLIAGLSDQNIGMLKQASQQILAIGIKPFLSQFSPVPGTREGDKRLKELGYYDSKELLLTNKILSVYRHNGWTGKEFIEFSSGLKNTRIT